MYIYLTASRSEHRSATSLKAQTVLHGVVAPCYQYHRHVGVDNKVPQFPATQSEPLD